MSPVTRVYILFRGTRVPLRAPSVTRVHLSCVVRACHFVHPVILVYIYACVTVDAAHTIWSKSVNFSNCLLVIITLAKFNHHRIVFVCKNLDLCKYLLKCYFSLLILRWLGWGSDGPHLPIFQLCAKTRAAKNSLTRQFSSLTTPS